MERPSLTWVSGETLNVRLNTGRVIPLASVMYDVERNRFWYEAREVTNDLTREQKKTFPSFDVARDNAAISDAKRGGTETGSTSTFVNFVSGVASDAAGIAGGIRKFFAGDPDKPNESSDLRKVVYLAAVLAVGFLAWKIIVAVKSK